jgi:hypothetical protein
MATHSPDVAAGLSNTSPLEDSARTELVSPVGASGTNPYQPPGGYEDTTLSPGSAPLGATEPFLPPTSPATTDPFLANAPAATATEQAATTPWMNAPAAGAVDAAPAPALVRRSRRESSWYLWVIFPLVSYCIFATIIIVILWNRLSAPADKPSELEKMPDIRGDNPLEKKPFEWTAKNLHTEKIPEKQRIKLGDTITIGSLEVTPLRVEKKVVRLFVDGYPKPQPCKKASLVLHLKLANLSDRFAFAPLDNFFDRQYKTLGEGSPPLTDLEVDKKRFFGGPTRWIHLKRAQRPKDQKDELREWVEGRKMVDPEVKPGESLESFVCTDGNNEELGELLDKYEGPLLWRVHLRCGPTQYKDRLIATTTVIGVDFTDKAYRN